MWQENGTKLNAPNKWAAYAHSFSRRIVLVRNGKRDHKAVKRKIPIHLMYCAVYIIPTLEVVNCK